MLLVDDDKTSNFLNERLLRRLDAVLTVHVTESGQQALDWLSQAGTQTPSLILLDVNMPAMSGLEFLQRYRQQFPERNTAVIVLTTTTNPAELAPFAPLDVKGILRKPLLREQLAAVLT